MGVGDAGGCGRLGIVASSVVCTVAVQRIEVITGAGGRRTYSPEEKIRLVGEAHAGRGAVAAVARRHGAPSTWRPTGCQRRAKRVMERHGNALRSDVRRLPATRRPPS
ncbi:transposase [Azospirillum brasilense]|nr:transposase [Azospirillum sp. INR13]MBK3798790.1 transposase [Azospirillum argentinense]